MQSTKEYLEIVNNAIDSIQYPAFPEDLYVPIKYALEAGGKRIRPILLLASNAAFNGELDQCIWPAVGIEIFHNFTLVHDDVMDHADMRRGRETVHKKYGLNAAILSGDAMVSMAYKCIAGCPPMFLPEVVDKFGLMTMKVYEGQQIDEDFETRTDVTFNEYLTMIIGKTSALIAYPCAIGAIIAGATPDDVEAIFNYGISLGIAFQMQDDYLDVYGDPSTFGKEIGGDILNDKKTWLHIIAKEKDKDNKFADLKNLKGQEKIDAVTDFYNSLNLKEQGKKLIENYIADALDCIESTTMSREGKDWFVDFTNMLLKRNK